ncbi:MAG: integrase family protein [Flavobacteriales bacterium]
MLTDKQVRNFKPKEKEYYITEKKGTKNTGSLLLRVTPRGKKEFHFGYYLNSKYRKKIKIGDYKANANDFGVTLAEARAQASEYSLLVRQRVCPKEHKQDKLTHKLREEKNRRELGSLSDLFNAYIIWLKTHERRSWTHAEYNLKHYVLEPFPELANKIACNVTTDDLIKVLKKMMDEGITTTANRVRGIMHAAYNRGILQDNDPRTYLNKPIKFAIPFNPVTCIPIQADWERVRDRFLTEEELHHFWKSLPVYQSGALVDTVDNVKIEKHVKGAYKMSPLFVLYFKLLFSIAGLRVEELAKVKWEYVNWDKAELGLPPEILKTGREIKRWHMLPLSSLSLDLLAELHKLTGHTPFLFPASHKGVVFRMDKYVSKVGPSQALKKHINTLKSMGQADNFEAFYPKDSRSTCKTLMGEAGICKEDRDRIQNHTISDVSSKHYDRYSYFKEKQAAINTWEKYLRWIIAGCDKKTRPTSEAA